MTREQVSKLLPVLQAYVEGKAIQYRLLRSTEKWTNAKDEVSFYPDWEYRIEPSPRIVYVQFNPITGEVIQASTKAIVLSERRPAFEIYEFVEVVK